MGSEPGYKSLLDGVNERIDELNKKINYVKNEEFRDIVFLGMVEVVILVMIFIIAHKM